MKSEPYYTYSLWVGSQEAEAAVCKTVGKPALVRI